MGREVALDLSKPSAEAVLPDHRITVVLAAGTGICTMTRRQLQRMVAVDRQGQGGPVARVLLIIVVADAIDRGAAAGR